MEALIQPFRAYYPIGQFAPSDLKLVRKALGQEGLDPKLVGLDSYARIRNCQILGSVLLDSDLIVAIDDDETVPPGYLERALLSAGRLQRRRGAEDAGLAGIYLDAAGDYRLKLSPEEAASANKFVRKAELINGQFELQTDGQGNGLVETPLALGGNMVFPRELFWGVSFDPGITRGEDIDYLMNSRLFGYAWFMDGQLSITHLPPKASAGDPVTTTAYAKLQRDVLRFFYQRRKIEVSQAQPGAEAASGRGFRHLSGASSSERIWTARLWKPCRPCALLGRTNGSSPTAEDARAGAGARRAGAGVSRIQSGLEEGTGGGRRG